MNNLKKYTASQALEKIKLWCVRQERCHSEVRAKLYQYGLYPSEVENIIVELITQNFLNEMRFAEAYVSGKFRIKGWGRIKIRQHLRQKHVSEFCISKAFEIIDADEYFHVLQHHLEKKQRLISHCSDYERRGKLYAFVAGKGFESDLIKDAIELLNT